MQFAHVGSINEATFDLDIFVTMTRDVQEFACKGHSFDHKIRQVSLVLAQHMVHSHKFITIELGRTSLLEIWGKLSTMSLFFGVVWENHGRL